MIDLKILGDRLKAARQGLGTYSKRQFAMKANIDPSQYNKAEDGEKGLGTDKLEELCSTWGLNRDWLLTGKGSMYVNSQDDDHGTVLPGVALLGPSNRNLTIDDYIKKIEEHNMFLQDVIRQGLVEIRTNLTEARQDLDEIEIAQRVQHTVMLNSLERIEKKKPGSFDNELSTLEQVSHQHKKAKNNSKT